MAVFSDLCNELILEILQYVPPIDLVSACTTTKSISYLAAPILEEHRRLQVEYSIIHNFTDMGHPLSKLLIDILTEPRIGQYVRCLSLNSWESWWDRDHEFASLASDQCRTYRYGIKNLQLLRTAVKTSEIIRADEVDEWLQACQDGTEDPILALLLLNLPYLNSLEVLSFGMPIERLSRTAQRIKNAPAGTYLSHLKHVSINFDAHWEKPDMMRFFMSFVSLPSLASCHIHGLIIGDDERDFEQHPRESNIADLSFTHCDIGERTYFEILRSTKYLRSFTGSSLGLPAPFTQQPLGWYWLGVGLLHHTKHSLEKLILLSHGNMRCQSCSLRDFEVLQEIHTELPLFLDDVDSSVKSFPEMLPASIRTINLMCPAERFLSESAASGNLVRMREAILNILEVKSVLLPRLTAIKVHTGSRTGSSIFVDIFEACDEQGVIFSLE